MRFYLFSIFVVAFFAPAIAPLQAAEPILTKDITDNVRVRLVAAKISETRGQNLMVQFVTLDDRKKEIVVTFPGHSHTTHETTLMNAARSCVEWTDQQRDWQQAKLDAVFSIPKDTQGYVTDFTRWYLVSIKTRQQ
jgi:hypothetical protein